jgi:hypothetical protein
MISNIIILLSIMLVCVWTGIWLVRRALVEGFRNQRIVVRGITYTGSKAVRWGVVCVIYAGGCAIGIGAAVVLLIRELH